MSVFVPSHITGFFNIENNPNPLKKGSCGGGFLLNKGVETNIKETSKDNVTIKINGKIDKINETIIYEVLDLLNISSGIKISQNIQVPIGAGFGTSAGSALGVAIGLSNIFDLKNDIIRSGQIAHLAEIKLNSGLGDVIAQLSKGIVLRVKAGAPGYGKTLSYNSEKLFVACKCFSKIQTSSIINNEYYKKVINSVGLNLKDRLQADFSVSNFINLSYEFSKKTKLIENEVLNLIKILSLEDDILGSSMAMLGNTAFAFSYNEDVFKTLDIDGLLVYELDNYGVKYDKT